MEKNKSFLIGAVFVALAIPIMDSFVTLMQQSNQYICTKIAVGTAKLQLELEKLSGEEEKVSTSVMGFQIPSDDEDEYEEEDE